MLPGGLFGSSYLNEAFRDFVCEQLATQTYLEDDGDTITSIAETMTINEFEYQCKRSFDIYNSGNNKRPFNCHGLRHDAKSMFRKNRLMVKT